MPHRSGVAFKTRCLEPFEILSKVFWMNRPCSLPHRRKYAERCKFHNQVRSTVAHERQRDTGNRHNAHIHSHVDENMRNKQDHNTCSKQRLKIALAVNGEL